MDQLSVNQKGLASTEDLRQIAEYFWKSVNSPRGLIQKVWFDLMLHLGQDGIQNQGSMRKESFILLKSQSDGRRRLQWKFNGAFRGSPIFDDPPNPLCPVKTFQLYLCKLDLQCTQIFQKPLETSVAKTSRFWYTVLPQNSSMLSLMMFDISKSAGTSKVHMNFVEQILPLKDKFYDIFRTAWATIDSFRIAPYETGPDGKPIAPFKLCQQCLIPVKSNKNDKSNGTKGILCSVVCYESFMVAKEMRQQQNPNVGASSSNTTASAPRSPSIIRNPRPLLPMQMSPQNTSQFGKNITPEIFKFIQQVARIQACGYPRPDGVPLLFKEDYTPVQAEMPKDLYDLTLTVINAGQNRRPAPGCPPSNPSSVGVLPNSRRDSDQNG